MSSHRPYFTKQTFERWQNLMRSRLGKMTTKNAHSLMLDVLAVDSGLKPSYLYDIGFPDPDKLLKFVRNLKDENLTDNHLSILQVGQDCLIVNPVGLSSLNFEELCSDCLINVSASLKTGPEMIKDMLNVQNIMTTVKTIGNNLSTEKSTLFQIDEHSCNITSLFGILLKYPLVYWYEQVNGNCENCLSMEKLTVVKVYLSYNSDIVDVFAKPCNSSFNQAGVTRFCNNTDNMPGTENNISEHCLYSFSYPSCLAEVASNKVSEWFTDLQRVVKDSRMFINVRMTREEKVLEAVAL